MVAWGFGVWVLDCFLEMEFSVDGVWVCGVGLSGFYGAYCTDTNRA